jgi:HEPN domain-containing protein
MLGFPLYRKDFKALADLRAEDARVLLSNGRFQGSYYLAGYAVECALKACIAKKTKRFEFPPKPDHARRLYTHGLTELLRLAGLDEPLETDMGKNKALRENWLIVKDWTEESRYSAAHPAAKDMYNAISGADGVLGWIKLRW